MFKIPIGDILASYSGDSKEFSFSWEIFDGYFDDILFKKPLSFSLQIIALDDAVEVHFKNLISQVEYDKVLYDVNISSFDREWRLRKWKDDPDDIGEVDKHSMTIDLAPVLREEIIMFCH